MLLEVVDAVELEELGGQVGLQHVHDGEEDVNVASEHLHFLGMGAWMGGRVGGWMGGRVG